MGPAFSTDLSLSDSPFNAPEKCQSDPNSDAYCVKDSNGNSILTGTTGSFTLEEIEVYKIVLV
jgi:hypothetical protein